MIDLNTFLFNLLSVTNFKFIPQLSKIVRGILCTLQGGITQKNISRQTSDDGYSLRSVQRFFALSIDWSSLYQPIIQHFLKDEEVLLASVDEVVQKKAGKSTNGLGFFFSSLASKVIPSVCFHVVSVIPLGLKKSIIVGFEQRQPTPKDKKSSDSKTKKSKKKATDNAATPQTESSSVSKKPSGRPKGSKNKNKTIEYTDFVKSFERLMNILKEKIAHKIYKRQYIVGDGAYGNKNILLVAQAAGFDLISKIRNTSKLFLVHTALRKKGKRGAGKKYGDAVQVKELSRKHPNFKGLHKEDADDITVEIYHFPQLWTKFLPLKINVVILVAVDKDGIQRGHKFLFSTDLELQYQNLIEYYSLRFQIEFNFRDAKQYYGLASFRAFKENQVANSVGLAFFMVNLAAMLRIELAKNLGLEFLSVLDLKALFNADKSVKRIIKMLDIDTETIKNKINIKRLAAPFCANVS